MMLRPRKGLNTMFSRNRRNDFNESNEYESNNAPKYSVSENIQGKHFTQSSNVEYLATTRTDSLTASASTASLLSQQEEQEYKAQHHQHHQQHAILTQRGFPLKRTHYTMTSPSTRPSQSQLQSTLPSFPGLLDFRGDSNGYSDGNSVGFTAQKWNYAKFQFSGDTGWNAHNPLRPTLQVASFSKQQKSQENPTNKSLLPFNSIRRIRRPRQWIPPQALLSNEENMPGDSSEEYCQKLSLTEKAKAFCVEFLQGSSIHGFTYMAKFGLSIVERTIWFAFICVALFSIISLSHRTWERFQTSPMVISMDRNKLVWNTSFPSLTVCPHKRIDELKVEDYIVDHETDFPTEEDKEDFRDFIAKLASITYQNIETLPLNKTFGIPSEKYLDLLYELKWNFEPEMSSGAAVKMYIYETITEFGICHAVNSIVARYNAYQYWRNNEWGLLEHGDPVTVHPLDGEIYAQIINLSTAYDVFFHGAGDIPSISKQRYTFPESDYTTVELIALEIYTAEEARAFTTKQRRCRFRYEAEEMLTAPIYSFGLCLAECRMFFALKVCGCVPHFYRNHLKNGRVLPICGLKGLACVVDIKRDIISLKSDRYKVDCKCLSNCDDSNFFVQSYRSRIWFLGANLQWGIIDYPKMQLRRDVLFSFADVLVYIGGLAGFFLGCSILSFTEVLYYFTARFVKRLFCN